MMIARFNIHANFTEELLNSLEQTHASHFILSEADIHQLDAVLLPDEHILTDFTIENTYINIYPFSQSTITSASFIHPFVKPSIIYHRQMTIHILKSMGSMIHNAMDLFLFILAANENIAYDRHVVFNFSNEQLPSKETITYLSHHSDNYTSYFNDQLSRYAKYHGYNESTPSYISKDSYYLLPDRILGLPSFLYRKLYDYFFKRKIQPYLQLKHQSKLNKAIVFLGFDYSYRGNSKYLFEEILRLQKENHPFLQQFQLYYVTNELSGEHFISPEHPRLKEIVQQSAFIILESFPPDALKFGGIIINLWHGTPIKRLFLDSAEAYQNENIFLYKLRKLNKMNRTDLFIADDPSAVHHFQTAFQLSSARILSCGYPRVEYLRRHAHNTVKIQHLKKSVNIKNEKPILFYCPTWRDYEYQPPDFERLKDRFEIITKSHPVDQSSNSLTNINLSTEDALLISDIVISDYSSVIFDALAINKSVYLLMDDLEQYKKTRGIYEDVIMSLQPYIYYTFDSLVDALSRYQPHHNPIEKKESMKMIINAMESLYDTFDQ